MFRLRTFGGLSLTEPGGGRPRGELRRSWLALLAVIAAGGERGISRDRLLALFWPERDEERARGSLKQALYSLRSELGAPALLLGSDALRLNASCVVSDVGDFEVALRAGDHARAVELYQGTFLDGFHIANGEFGRWQEEQAADLAFRYRGALSALAQDAESRLDHPGAARWWRALVAAEPLSAAATLSLMKALAKSGDRTAALEHARSHEQQVRRDLETAPDASVTALAARMRQEVEGTSTRASEERIATAPVADSTTLMTGVDAPAAARPGRRRHLLALAAIVLTTVIGALVVAANARPRDPDQVRLTVRSAGTPFDSQIVSQLEDLLLQRDRTLKVTHGDEDRPRFTALISSRTEGDSTQLMVAVVDASTGTPLAAIEPASVHKDAPYVGLRALGERLGVVLAAQRHPYFASWAHSASMPTNWASYRELQAGIGSWGDSRLRSDPVAHFAAAAALDTTSATPLVWKALVLSKRGDTAASDSVLASLATSTRRLGAWDHALVSVLKAGNAGDIAGAYAVGRRELLGVALRSEWSILVAYDATTLGRQREALEIMRDVTELSGWSRKWSQVVRIQALHLSGDYGAELAIARAELQADPDSRWGRQIAVRPLAGLGRTDEAASVCTSSITLGRPRVESGTVHQLCRQAIMELWGHGHPAEARALAIWFSSTVIAVDTISAEAKLLARAELLQSAGDWKGAAQDLGRVREPIRDVGEYLRLSLLNSAAAGDRAALVRTRARIAVLERRQVDSPTKDALLEAELAAMLGDSGEAVGWIAKMFRDGYRFRTLLHIDASFERLHGDPRFEAFMRPVNGPDRRAQVVSAR